MFDLLWRISFGLLYGLICYGIGRFLLSLLKLNPPPFLGFGMAVLLGAFGLSLQVALFIAIGLPLWGFLLYGPWVLLLGWRQWRRAGLSALKAALRGGRQSIEQFINLTVWEKLLLGFLAYALFMFWANQITSPFDSWDATAMWLFKAKHFYTSASLDQSLFMPVGHPDYPIAYPLMIVSFYMLGIGVEEQLVFNITSVFMLAGVALLYGLARRHHLPLYLSLGLPIVMLTIPDLTYLLYSRAYLGYADFQVGVAFLLCAACLSLWLEEYQPAYLGLSLLAIALAASLKNEGLTFVLLGGLAIAFSLLLRPRQIGPHLKAWPVWVGGGVLVFCVVGWNIYTKLNNYVTDISSGFSLGRFTQELPKRFDTITTMLGDHYKSDIKYLALLVMVVLTLTSLVLVHNRLSLVILLLLGLLLGQAALYLFVYVVTPNELVWHINTTISRLTAQLVPLIFGVFTLALANVNQMLLELADRKASTAKVFSPGSL